MELKHQLIPHLKHLRLSGILETLEVRNRQAIEGQWSYVEFLSRLLEDEVERRAQKQLGLRLRRAALSTAKTLWYISAENRLYNLAEKPWYILAENKWYIYVR